jgi:adenine deaminase
MVRKQWTSIVASLLEDAIEEDIKLAERFYQWHLQAVGMMRNAGVGLLAGTDCGNPYTCPGFGIHDELRLLVEAGLTPLEALQAATLDPARFFERESDLGTVAKGKVADLVLLDANPLADITNTTRINAVIAAGRLFETRDLQDMLCEGGGRSAQGMTRRVVAMNLVLRMNATLVVSLLAVACSQTSPTLSEQQPLRTPLGPCQEANATKRCTVGD